MFDGIEVGAVGRQIAYGRAGSLDRFSDPRDLVAGKIIHDDHIAVSHNQLTPAAPDAEEFLFINPSLLVLLSHEI